MEMKEATTLIHGDAFPVTHRIQPRAAARVLFLFIGAAAWWFLYRGLEPFAKWITYGVLSIPAGGHLASALEFFIYEAPKVLMLLTVVVFGVGIVRSFFTPERTRRLLAGQREAAGNVLASLPETIILRKVLKVPLIAVFAGVVTLGILVVGLVFNIVM